jgi:hypothetical protein
MKILVCGGRDYNDKEELNYILDTVTDPQHSGKIFPSGWTYLIHGGARGADTLAGEWAKKHCVPTLICWANWDAYGKSAGFHRNKLMLELGQPDLVIAMPGGKGTAMMIDLAKKAGVRVEDYGRPGSEVQTKSAQEA